MFNRAGTRLALVASLFCIFTLSTEASMQHRMSADNLAPLAGPVKLGAKLKIAKVPLADGEEAVLEVERFQVWADNADIKVFGANEEVLGQLAPPAAQYFRGRVAGQPDSVVFLAVTGDVVEGLIYTTERKFALGTERQARTGKPLVVIQESGAMDDIPAEGQEFMCDLEKVQLNRTTRPRAISDAAGQVVPQAAPAGTQRSVIHLAVDTDYELFDRAGDTAENVTTYIGNLMAAVSTIYERDLKTEVRIAYLGIQTNIADPFLIVPGQNGKSALHALFELGDRWASATPPSTALRSAATLVSGKTQASGVAWVGTLCGGSFLCSNGNCGSADANGHYAGPYSFNGGIAPPANLSVPNPDAGAGYVAPSSNYWPVLQVAHELGHNVGSSHTHCMSLSAEQKTEYNVTRNWVDECYSGQGGCFSGTVSVPAEKGSIMSYCHLRSPGFGSNTRFTFGQPNETSEVALDGMLGNMAGLTPAMSSITAPVSLNVNVTGNASVANVGYTYSWKIVNGTFTGGGTTASGAAVSFSGTANPVLLTVTATDGACSVTDTKSVTIITASLTAPQNVVATPSGAVVAVSWSAVTGATSYEIFRKMAGMEFASIGSSGTTTFNDATASPATAYLYKVRATAGDTTGPLSNQDLASTYSFTDATLSAGSSKVKGMHFNELLSAINGVRGLAGQAAVSFATPAPATTVSIRRSHLIDLRTALDQARAALGVSSLSYTDATVTSGSTKVKAAHLTELRNGIK